MTIVADSPAVPGVRLQRSLGALGVILLTLSWLSPAASVMVAGSDIFHHAGTGAIWAFLIGGAVMAVVTTTQAELGASFPLAGGDYATIARSLGPFGGFLAFVLAVLLLPALSPCSHRASPSICAPHSPICPACG
jgi:amino acid transporter